MVLPKSEESVQVDTFVVSMSSYPHWKYQYNLVVVSNFM